MKNKNYFWISFILSFVFITPLIASSSIEELINTYFNNIKIEKLKKNSNFFSAVLNQKGNTYKIVGTDSPLDAEIYGKLKYVYIGNIKIDENMTLNAHIKNNIVKGNVIFANYIGFLTIKLNQKADTFIAKNIDIKYICKKIKLKVPKDLEAKADINLKHFNNKFLITLNIKGVYKKSPLISQITIIMNKSSINIKGYIKNKILSGNFNILKDNKLLYSASFNKISLEFFHLIYPFKGIIDLKIQNDLNNIVKFTSKNFSGFYEKKSLNVTFNMSSKDFFKYINIDNIFQYGIVSGNLDISKKGDFNFIIKDAILKRNFAKKLKIKRIFNKIFIRGNFNNKYVVFDLLYNDKNLNINITKGKLIIKSNKINPSFVITIQKGNTIYKYKINQRGIFLINKKINKTPDDEILIY